MNKARRKNIDRAIALLEECKGKLEDAKSIVEQASNDEREAYDNMPEGLQQGEKGETCDAAAQALEEVDSSLGDIDIDDMISKLSEARG